MPTDDGASSALARQFHPLHGRRYGRYQNSTKIQFIIINFIMHDMVHVGISVEVALDQRPMSCMQFPGTLKV